MFRNTVWGKNVIWIFLKGVNAVLVINLKLKLRIKLIKSKSIRAYTLKYTVHSIVFKEILASIHLMWLIEENAIIFRMEVWLRPIMAPITAESMIDPFKIK